MEDPSNQQIQKDLEAADKDSFSLIDGSTLDDLFVSMSEPRFVENKATIVDEGANLMEPPEAQKSRNNEKYNLRKSLAWDSAFFTSAGVLDAEELSTIMEGGNGGKQQTQHLPGIQEDISKSTDSLSTLASDNLSLESLEADLFSDIRASIQRSGESSNLRKSNLNGRPEVTSHLGKRITEIKHANTVKTKSTPKKLSTNIQDGKMLKLGPSREQVKKPVVSRREPSLSLLKPAASSGKGSSMVMAPAKVPIKRMSISAGRVKSDTNNVGNEIGRVTNMSKGDRPGVSRSVIPKAASYAKSSSGSSTTTRTGISSNRSSIDSTSSSKSESSRMLPLNGLQGKASRPASIPPPGVKSRIPSRVPLKGKNLPSSSRISAKLSATLLSPSVSPTSSISEWSSSSSTVIANQEHSVSKDGSSLHRSFSLDSNASQDLQIHVNEQALGDSEFEVVGVVPHKAEELPAGNIPVSNAVSSKPTGLRMPSPKIGFFDGVKSGARAQNASVQSRSRLSSSRLPKSTTGSSSPGGAPNKGTIGHAAVKATASTPISVNPDTPRSNARVNATVGERLTGISAASKDSNVRASKDISKTTSPKTNGENNYRTAKSPAGEKRHCESGSNSMDKSELDSPLKNGNPDGKSHFHDNQVSSDIKPLNPHLLHELNNEDKVDTEYPEEKSHFQANQVSSAVAADHQIMKVNDDPKFLNPDLLHELINGDKSDTVNMSEEVGNAVKAEENADMLVVDGGHEPKPIVKNDPECDVITYQQNVFAEQNVIGLIANVDAVGNMSGLCEEMQGNNEPHSNVNFVCDTHSAVSCTLELSGLNQKMEAADLLKQTDLCVSSKILESNSGSRTPADKHSSPDAYAMECYPINMSKEVGHAIEVDNADTVVVNGGYEAIIENSDLSYAVISEQQNLFAELQENELIENVDASDVHSPAGSCSGELSGLYRKENAADLPKQTDLVVSSKILESDSGSTTALADENSSPDAYATEGHLINMSEEAGNAIKVDENEDTAVVNGGYEATIEKGDLNYALITDHQNAFAEQQVKECIADVDASDSQSPAVSSNAELSGLNRNEETAYSLKQTDICVSSEILESNPVCRTPLSDKKKSELVSPSKNGSAEGRSQFQDDLVNNVVEADHQIMEMNEDHQNAFAEQQVNELIADVDASDSQWPAVSCNVEFSGLNLKEEAADLPKQTDICVSSQILESNPVSRTPLSEKKKSELVSPSKIDLKVLNPDLLRESVNGDEVDTEEEGIAITADNNVNTVNDPKCAMITDQQNAFVEQQLSGLNRNEEATDICVSSKILESNPSSRTPLAEKNSSPDAYNIEVLLKSFTSLSLENVQAKDVETRMT